MQTNKTDDNDAYGLAQIVRTEWYRAVKVKSLDSHLARSLLAARAQLVQMRTDLMNQIRGILKTFGLVIGLAHGQDFAARVQELVPARSPLRPLTRALLAALRAVAVQIAALDREVLAIARTDAICHRLMTVPAIGPITALSFRATLDDPSRFARSSSVGAYLGLTPRRYQSGETDRTGRISKCGDGLLRHYLFEAAGVLLTRVGRWSQLKAWGLRLTKRIGLRKAKVAVARKLAVVLYRIWCDGSTFRWSDKEVTV
jgi:transposase